MIKGTLIGFFGVGGRLFSQGLDDIAKSMRDQGWQTLLLPHANGDKALAWLNENAEGPVAMIGHSMGANTVDWLAEQYGKPVDAVFMVASAFPETLPDNVNKVFAITGDKDWRQFTIEGGKVLNELVIKATHTSIDNSEELHRVVERELRLLAQPKDRTMLQKFDSILDDLDAEWVAFMDPANETDEAKTWYKEFFSIVRRSILKPLSQEQVNGLKTMVFVWRKYFSEYPLEFFAACAGQAVRETGGQMISVRETFAQSTDQALRRMEKAWANGQYKRFGVKTPYWRRDSTGYPFGRGIIQLTLRDNYTKAEKLLKDKFGISVDLDGDYDLALDPLVSAIVCFGGCIHGTFRRGLKLEDYYKSGALDYYNARDVVNGDKGKVGADIRYDCQEFEYALKLAETLVSGFLAGKVAATLPDTQKTPPAPIPGNPDPHPKQIPGRLPNLTLTQADLEQLQTEDLAEASQRALQLISMATSILEQRGQTAAQKLPPPTPTNEPGETEMAFTGTKSLFKSKTILGIGGAIAALWFPPLKPILDIFTPDVIGAVTPDLITQAKEQAVETYQSVQALIATLMAIYAAWGRTVADTKIKL